MKNKLRASLILLLVLTMVFVGTVPAHAAAIDDTPSVMPLMDNCDVFSMSFDIIDPNLAGFAVTYYGTTDTFSHAKLTVQIQKKNLLFFWETQEIGDHGQFWIQVNTSINGVFTDEFTVNGTGTYRALFTLEVYGTNGTVDVIEETIECVYS